MRFVLGSTAAVAWVCAVSVIAAPAHADEAVIKYRKAVMEAVGGHTQALAEILKGNVPFSGDAKAHATALAALGQMSGHLFPEGSGKGDTEALPAIWEKPAEFKEVLDGFQATTARLGAAATTDDIKAAFGDVTKNCKACHDKFRKKT
jgi:cytochrome c556